MSGDGRKFRNGRDRKAALVTAARALVPDSAGWDAQAVHEAIKQAHGKPRSRKSIPAERYAGAQFAERMKHKKESGRFMGWYDRGQKAGAPSPTPSTYRAARAAEDAYFLAMAETMLGKPALVGGRTRGARMKASAKASQVPAMLQQVRAEGVGKRREAREAAKRLGISAAHVRKNRPKSLKSATPSATRRVAKPQRSRSKP